MTQVQSSASLESAGQCRTGTTARPRPARRFSQSAAVVALTLLAGLWVRPALAVIEGTPERKAADVLSTIGVNLHIGSDGYNDPARLLAMLDYLGIHSVRQTSPDSAKSLETMQALGHLGVRFDMIVNGGGPVDLTAAMRPLGEMAPFLNAVEGVNEAANYPVSYRGRSGLDAAVALQKDLYAAVRADSRLTQAAVYMFTIGSVDPYSLSLGDLSAYADYANIHSYPPHGLRPIFVIHAAIDGGRTIAPSLPVVITETGYYTLPENAGWGGVPEHVQASYLLCLLLDEAVAGVARTYLYDLIDDAPDPAGTEREYHFGLFRHDGSPKPVATALRAMTAILSDTQPAEAGAPPGVFAFQAPGVPYDHTGNTLLMTKSDGTRVLAVWNEQQLWDPDTRIATPPVDIPIEVAFASPQETVLLYDPLVSSDPIQTVHHVATLPVQLSDHPLFVVIPPTRVETAR